MVALKEAALVSGRYRLERLLGRGGMSEVWRARDERLDRPVAVKLLEPSPSLSPEFEREAGALSRLRHPNILAIYDAGQHRGRRYLVMELVEGPSLRAALQERGQFPPEDAAQIGAALADALAYAHAQGVLHNDVKPENVLLEADGRPRLSDFGIARVTGATVSLENASQLLGTVAYLAPEVLQGSPPSEQSDVYSLALTVYEVIAGELPFRGVSSAAIAGQKLSGDATRLREVVPEAPPLLEEALAAALAPSPRQRPAAAAFATALQRSASQTRPIRRAAPVVAVAPVPGAAPPSNPEPAAAVHPQPTPRPSAPPPPVPPRGPRWPLFALAGGAALFLGGAAFLLAADDDDQQHDDPRETSENVAVPSAEPSLTPTPTKPPQKPTRTPTVNGEDKDDRDDDDKDEDDKDNDDKDDKDEKRKPDRGR